MEKIKKEMHLEEMMEAAGGCGRFQWIHIAILSFSVTLCALLRMTLIFYTAIPDHICSTSTWNNFTVSETINMSIPLEIRDGKTRHSQCKMYDFNKTEMKLGVSSLVQNRNSTAQIHCTSWSYDRSVYDNTVVTQFDLVCERRWMVATSQSVYMAGLLVGVFFFGQLSDRFGRRTVIILTCAACNILAYSVIFSPNYMTFVILRFGIASTEIAFVTISYVLSMELVGKDWRLITSVTCGFLWTIGYMAITGLAYFLRDWRHLNVTIAAINTPYLVYAIFFMPSSPRWLHSQKMGLDSIKMIRKIADTNGKTLPDNVEITEENTDTKRAYAVDLFRTPKMRKRSIVQIYIWCVCSAVYYGLSLGAGDWFGSPYLNNFLNSVIEIPASVMVWPLAAKLGRVRSVAGSMILGGAALLCTLPVPEGLGMVVVVLSLVGKCAVSISFSLIYIVAVEISPTVVRNIALGSYSTSARVGGVCAPFLLYLNVYNKDLSNIILGGLAVIAGFLALILPESRGKPLPETIEDAENFRRIISSVDKNHCALDKKPQPNNYNNDAVDEKKYQPETKKVNGQTNVAFELENNN